MSYEQRDIVLIPFPYTDLTASKQRPALIISNSRLNKSEDRICCLITSNSPEEGILITNNSFEKGTLPFQSWIKPHRMFTIHQKLIKQKLCKVTSEFHKNIINAVNDCIMLD